MYSEQKVLEKLARFKEKYGWLPVEHSVEEVDRMNAYFKQLCTTGSDGEEYFDDDSWTPRLKRWVMNERAMCAISCTYFLTRYFWLTDSDIIHYSFRSGQKALYRVFQELEQKGVSIECQVLKARKQGISTLVEGMMTHSALFIPGAKCSIGSADDQKTAVMMDMMYGAMEHIPWWLPPEQTKDKRSGRALLQFSHVGTSIVVQSGSMKGGIGQGTTPSRVHLSECCDYTDPVVQIEEGLFKAVPSTPDIFMVLESTGNGNTGWWANQWRANKEKYWQGRARLLPVFLPWFMTPELYPSEHWIKKFPFPGDWHPTPDVITMKNKCEAYVKSTKILSDILGKDWQLPPEQQWYWQFNWEDALERRTSKSWLRQMACDDFEALIGDRDSVFDWETVHNIETHRNKSPEVFGILGDGINERHDPPPSLVDKARYPIMVNWKTPGDVKLNYVFMPLSGDPESQQFDPLKKFLIYEHPKKGETYAIGIDTGSGVGGDRTVINVTRTGRSAVSDVQVAEWTSDDIDEVAIYAWVVAIAAYYSQFYEDETTCRLVIEQRTSAGDSCYHSLKLHGFTNWHKFREYDKKTLRPKVQTNQREGWFTNAWSRPLLLGMFKYAVDGGWYVVNSRWAAEEIEGVEQAVAASGATRMDHAQGKHDDRIFAMAMSYFTLHDLDVMAERAKKKYNSPQDEELEIEDGPWFPKVDVGGEEFFDEYEVNA